MFALYVFIGAIQNRMRVFCDLDSQVFVVYVFHVCVCCSCISLFDHVFCAPQVFCSFCENRCVISRLHLHFWCFLFLCPTEILSESLNSALVLSLSLSLYLSCVGSVLSVICARPQNRRIVTLTRIRLSFCCLYQVFVEFRALWSRSLEMCLFIFARIVCRNLVKHPGVSYRIQHHTTFCFIVF